MSFGLDDRFQAAAGLAASVITYAQQRGIDAAPLARAAGIDPEQSREIFGRISLAGLCRLLEALALLTGDEEFGIKTGAALDRGISGPFGYALIHAPTMRDAIWFVGRNLYKITDLSHCVLAENPDEARFEWSYSPLILRREQFADMSTVMLFAHLRSILGPDIDLVNIELERARPKNPQNYKDLISRNISFGATVNALVVPAALLARKNPSADTRLFDILRKQVADIPAERPGADDPVTATRYQVLDNITQPPTLGEIANRLGMSERTLQRRLTSAGTSLQAITDDSRKEMAARLLKETSLNLSEISYRLGFSAPSAFTRSATRWFGISPSQYRQKSHD